MTILAPEEFLSSVARRGLLDIVRVRMCGKLSSFTLGGVAGGWLLLGISICHAQSRGNQVTIPTPGLASIEDCPLTLQTVPEQAGGEKAPPLEITEIHFQAPENHPDSEFIELVYTGANSLDVSGWRFDKGVKFTFPDNTILANGKPVLVVRDMEAFARAFKTPGNVLGAFDGGLKRRGESLRVVDAKDMAITDVRYATAAPWPAAISDGSVSLQRIDLDHDVDDPATWTAAAPSPGKATTVAPSKRFPLSLYQILHAPETPEPGKPTTVTAWLAPGTDEPIVQLTLHVDANGKRFEKALMVTHKKGVPRQEIRGTIGALPPGTFVRYWFTVRSPASETPRQFPSPNEQTTAYLIPTAEAPPESPLPVYQLWLEETTWQSVQDQPYADTTRWATFVHESNVYPVRVRCRGAFARGWPKKCFKVFFENSDGFRDQDRINLNSAYRDVAYVREPLAYSIYRDLGVPAPESRLVRLDVNGKFWGIFAEVEQVNEDFLNKWKLEDTELFKAVSGAHLSDQRNLKRPEAYSGHYQNGTGIENDFTSIHAFCEGLAKATDKVAFFEKHVDLEHYTNYLCTNAVIQHWDSYSKNHYIAKQSPSNQWLVIPWNVDRTLGDDWSWGFKLYDLSPFHGAREHRGPTGWNRLMDAYWKTPTLRKRYLKRLTEVLNETFTEERLFPRIDQLSAGLKELGSPDFTRWGKMGRSRSWHQSVQELKAFVKKRRAYLQKELRRLK